MAIHTGALTFNDCSLERINKIHRLRDWMVKLVSNDFLPIFVGDTVRIADRFIEDSPPYFLGLVGRVTSIEDSPLAALSPAYLRYSVKTSSGLEFTTSYFSLDRLNQTDGNKELERSLRANIDNYLL